MNTALLGFITSLRYDRLPAHVRRQATRCLVDLLGAAVAGRSTPTACIMADYAAATFAGQDATVLGAGRVCNAAGAALANACAANALDIDDGFRPAKGHPGAVIIPAALAQAEALGASGADFLTALVVGYEVGMRASVAWHRNRALYHASGSWGATAAAAACASLLRLDAATTWHALGTAEYHAPFGDILLACEEPAMVKDGIHWGALTGVSAAQLAARGFTGIPSLLTLPAQADLVADLGSAWWIERLYFKFFPCCRWAQPAVAGVLALRARHGIRAADVERIRVETFEHATHLVTRRPRNTEEAQYSLPFPVACAAVRGQVTPAETAGSGLDDPEVLAMAQRVEMSVDPALEARFPAEALERVTIELNDGTTYTAGPLDAPGDAEHPPTDDELQRKFFALVEPVLGRDGAFRLFETGHGCAQMENIGALTELLV